MCYLIFSPLVLNGVQEQISVRYINKTICGGRGGPDHRCSVCSHKTAIRKCLPTYLYMNEAGAPVCITQLIYSASNERIYVVFLLRECV